LLWLILYTAATACASIPDVEFRDGDGGASTDASRVQDAEAGSNDGGGWSCPAHPPPEATGSCCGPLLCLHWAHTHCGRCGEAGGASDQICCRTGNSANVDCTLQASCN